MGNRKQPFGYKMSLGEIVIQESEAKLVQEVFRRYIAGESLNELTEALRQQDIPYDEGRLWNKNMIARILADARYTGEKEYPKLIDKEQLIAANEKRSNKPQLPKKTEAQKVLRRLCGASPSERVLTENTIPPKSRTKQKWMPSTPAQPKIDAPFGVQKYGLLSYDAPPLRAKGQYHFAKISETLYP